MISRCLKRKRVQEDEKNENIDDKLIRFLSVKVKNTAWYSL